MATKTKHTPETVQVFPLDKERLNKDINQSFHKDGEYPDNVFFEIHRDFAIMREPKLCIIDEEFIGEDIEDKVAFSIYKQTKLSDGHFTMGCLPEWKVTFTLAQLEPYFKLSVSLAEFTKERRGYNSRIKCNEAEWVRYLNS